MLQKIALLLGVATMLTVGSSTTTLAQSGSQNSKLSAKADKWFSHHKYLKGLTILPHESVNHVELYCQYKKNQPLWDAAFAFLKNTNLDTLKVGKYKLLGDDVFVNVSEGTNRPIEKTKWEFHRKYIDLQYVYDGKEVMGVTPIDSIEIESPYSDSWDGGTGKSNSGKYYTMDRTKLQLFFPTDAHRPGIAATDCKKVKKIVIKIRYS